MKDPFVSYINNPTCVEGGYTYEFYFCLKDDTDDVNEEAYHLIHDILDPAFAKLKELGIEIKCLG